MNKIFICDARSVLNLTDYYQLPTMNDIERIIKNRMLKFYPGSIIKVWAFNVFAEGYNILCNKEEYTEIDIASGILCIIQVFTNKVLKKVKSIIDNRRLKPLVDDCIATDFNLNAEKHLISFSCYDAGAGSEFKFELTPSYDDEVPEDYEDD